MITILFFLISGISDITCIFYDFFFKDIYNDMWFSTYTKEIVSIDEVLKDIASELKKEFKQSIDNADPVLETKEMLENFFKRWEKK
jgi:hypothetical protein